MMIREVLRQLADTSDAAIDEEIASLEGQLELLKLIRKKRTPVSGSAPKKQGTSFEECTIDKVTTVISAIGSGTSMSVRSNLPNCHHLSVIRCLDQAVERGVLHKTKAGVFTLVK